MPRRKFDAWIARPDSRVALVGASGWVGAALADRILDAAPGLTPDRLRLFTSVPRVLTIGDAALRTEPLSKDVRLGGGDWLVLHAGVIGAPPGGDLPTMRRQNDALLASVLDLAGTGAVRRLVMTSSGAARHPGEGGLAKAAYSRMKRDHEDAVAEWAERMGTAVLLPRIYNLGGPYITYPQNYALGDFILSQAKTGRITIGSGDPVVRDFTHVLELAGVLLDMAVDETERREPFDIGGDEAVELADLARLIGQAFGTEPAVERPAPSGGPGDRYVGDGSRYQAALTKAGQAPAPLPAIVADTIAYLRKTGAISPD
jgi:nucleoside-diphosphate-sugar epimerase